jgi:flavin-binding protein dodecin
MAKIYKQIEITAESTKSVSDAVAAGVAKASETLRNLDWFEVCEIRGSIQKGKPTYQVSMKIGFRLED